MATPKSLIAGAAFLAAATLPLTALAEKPAHPLLDPTTTAPAYSGDLLKIAAELLGPPGATRGGGAVASLEDSLREGPEPKPRGILYPNVEAMATSRTNTKAVFYFGLPAAPTWNVATLPFCIQKSHEEQQILAAGGIPVDGHVFRVPTEQFNGLSCMGFLKSPVSKDMLAAKIRSAAQLAARP